MDLKIRNKRIYYHEWDSSCKPNRSFVLELINRIKPDKFYIYKYEIHEYMKAMIISDEILDESKLSELKGIFHRGDMDKCQAN